VLGYCGMVLGYCGMVLGYCGMVLGYCGMVLGYRDPAQDKGQSSTAPGKSLAEVLPDSSKCCKLHEFPATHHNITPRQGRETHDEAPENTPANSLGKYHQLFFQNATVENFSTELETPEIEEGTKEADFEAIHINSKLITVPRV
jgi:hypothetical protein